MLRLMISRNTQTALTRQPVWILVCLILPMMPMATSLPRAKRKITGSDYIDQLTYTHLPNSNKLLNVLDKVNDVQTKLGDFRASAAYMNALGGNKITNALDYSYDDNGNLKQDNNKDIASITYNYLNLPEVITTAKGTITYTYDATGNKPKKVVQESNASVSLLLTPTPVFCPAYKRKHCSINCFLLLTKLYI